jgi:DNA-binding transcriptional MerR regulator
MSQSKEGPRFNLKAVVRQTGLKPDTVRAWERRYGLPSPERSAGGHRLYSRRDIDTIQWLTARQREGLSIKRAVDLWRQIDAEGRDPLQAAMPIAAAAAYVQPPQLLSGTIAQLLEAWIDACLAYDEQRAEQVVNQAFALYPPETVAVGLMQRAVSQIGKGWYQGDVTVQQEHFCSALIIRRLEALLMGAPPSTRPGRILVACPPQENHIIGPLLLTFLLRRRGWDVVYLDANVPVAQLETTVAVTRPQLVIMAAQQLHTAATLVQIAQVLQRQNVPLAYGGLIFNLLPTLRRRIPGHFLGEQLEAAPQVVESLMTAPRPAPQVEAIPELYLQAADYFGERQPLVDAHVMQTLGSAVIAHNHLAMANRELGLNIGAALALGDMAFLGADIEWLAGLLKNHGWPVESLHAYLQAYYLAAKQQMDKRGEPVISWLGKLVNGFQPG